MSTLPPPAVPVARRSNVAWVWPPRTRTRACARAPWLFPAEGPPRGRPFRGVHGAASLGEPRHPRTRTLRIRIYERSFGCPHETPRERNPSGIRGGQRWAGGDTAPSQCARGRSPRQVLPTALERGPGPQCAPGAALPPRCAALAAAGRKAKCGSGVGGEWPRLGSASAARCAPVVRARCRGRWRAGARACWRARYSPPVQP